MANSHAYTHYSSPQLNDLHDVQRAYTDQIEKRLDNSDIVQGRIFWLPCREELPERAVKRAHGKGVIEEGIFNHPIVIVSRPVEEDNMAHFHLITSLQGKKLHQLYSKSNEFHASRRSWYLPIAPTPDHPDATSNKSRKRFPTLELANSATLRWDSYVNIRHVYKIDWSLLRAYTNPEAPNTQFFEFESESVRRLLAKSKFLTTYEPGQQMPNLNSMRSISMPVLASKQSTQTSEQGLQKTGFPLSDTSSTGSAVYSRASISPWSGFRKSDENGCQKSNRPPKTPPDVVGKLIAMSFDPDDMRRPFDQFLTNVKGVLAVTIASI